MWRIHRYYAREVVMNTVLSFAVLFGIVLIATVSRGIRRAEGFELVDAALITFFWAADALMHLVPIALLFATVLTFARASQARELVAFQAAGISTRVPMKSALLVGVACSLLAFWIMHWVLPQTHYWKTRVVADALRDVIRNTGMSGDSLRYPGSGLCATWDYQDETGAMRNLVVFLGDEDSELNQLSGRGILRAESLDVRTSEDGQQLVLRLNSPRDPIQGALGGTRLEEFEFSLSINDLANATRRTEEDEDLSSDHLVSEILRDIHPDPVEAEYHIARRSAFAFLPLLLAPLGFCIGHLAREKGRVVALTLAGVPLGVFYTGDFLGTRLVQASGEPLFGFTSVVILALAGAPLLWRVLRT